MTAPGPMEPAEIPRPSEGWWERVPVLNELYKLLSSTGPVNWELARQVATALAAEDEPAVRDADEVARELEALTRGAEVEAEGFSGLAIGAVVPVEAVDRSTWVEANIETFKSLMEPLARKLTGAQAGNLPFPMPAQATQLLEQVGGILMGLQTGFVLGYLGKHVIGQYEVTLPSPGAGRLLYVVPNLVAVEREWELEPREFRYWIALHETTHHLQFSRPWVRNYFHGQLRTLIESLDVDPERMASSFEGLGMLDPEKMQEALSDPEQLMRAAFTPLAEDTVQRLQAFMTLIEGYATFVMDAVGARVLKDHPRLKEVMERRKRTQSPGEALFERMLGLDVKRRQYEEGVAFCRYVAGMRDVAALNRVWDNPDSLPTAEEIAEPDAWIARVLEG